MQTVKNIAEKLAPSINSIWFNLALVVVMVAQLLVRNPVLIVLAMLMIFVFFGVQMMTQNLTKRQRILYTIILSLNAVTVLLLAWAAMFG